MEFAIGIYVDQTTGKPFRLFRTEQLSEDLLKFDENDCSHEREAICEVTYASGTKHYRRQCQTCGAKLGTPLAKSKVETHDLVPFQPNLQEQYQAERSKERAGIVQKHIDLQKKLSGEFSAAYKDHLKSEFWKKTRIKVINRAGGLCEGCLEREATDIHHQTYEHLGYEFMFELLAVCDSCHRRLHEHLNEARKAQGLVEIDYDREFQRLDCQCRFYCEDGLTPECDKFGMLVAQAIAFNGPCGPDRAEHEEYR
jgi:hypothetical protein